MTSAQLWPLGRATGGASSGPSPTTAYDTAVLADAPLCYWKMDDKLANPGAAMADASGNSRPLVLSAGQSNAPSAMPTGSGGVFFNNSIYQYAKANYAAWQDQPNAYSADVWVRPADTSGTHAIAARDWNTGRAWQMLINNGNKFTVDDSTAPRSSNTALVNNQAYHLAFTYNATTKILKLYINGYLDATFTNVTLNNNNSALQFLVGVTLAGTTGNNYGFYGTIDHFAYYGTELSAARILAHYQTAFPTRAAANYHSTVLADTPVGYWKLDETTGTTMADSSGNGRDGAYSGATLFQAPLVQDGGFSALGGASGQGVGNVAYGSWMNADAFSAECWVKPTNTGDARGVFSRFGGTSGWWIIWQRSGTLGCTMGDGSGTQCDLAGPTLAAGQLYHVVMVVSGTTESLYINGVFFASRSVVALSGSNPGSAAIEIGGYNSSNYCQAYVDNAAFYTYALSATRIAAHYAAGLVSFTNPSSYDSTVLADQPVAYYPLNESVNTSHALDWSGTNRHGWYSSYPGNCGLNAETTNRGKAVEFDGVAGCVLCPPMPDNWTYPAWTIECWAKFAVVQTWHNLDIILMTNGFSGSNAIAAVLGVNVGQTNSQGKASGSFYNAGWKKAEYNTLITAGVWHHYAATLSGGTLTFYLDGAQVAQATGQGSVGAASTNLFYLARRWDNGLAYNFTPCEMSNAAIYNTALSAARIAAHYAAG